MIVEATHIHLIIGLPGSGKSYYASHNLQNIPVIDDIVSINQLPNVPEFVIIDVNFCDSTILAKAKDALIEKYGYVIFYEIYFENNAEKARTNVLSRNDGRNIEGTIRRFTKIYSPPDDALKIFIPNRN